MNFENLDARVLIGVRELNLSVNTTRTEQSIVKNVDSIGCHNNLDVLSGFETIKLVEELKHGTLYF